MRRMFPIAGLVAGAFLAIAPSALADGGGPAKVDLEKAVKKGTAIVPKIGAAEEPGHEYHISSNKAGNGVVGVKVYLYATDTGTPLKSLTGKVICNPCEYTVGGDKPQVKLNLDDMFEEKGGFPKTTPNATGLVVVGTNVFTDVSFMHVDTSGSALTLTTHFISSDDFDKIKL